VARREFIRDSPDGDHGAVKNSRKRIRAWSPEASISIGSMFSGKKDGTEQIFKMIVAPDRVRPVSTLSRRNVDGIALKMRHILLIYQPNPACRVPSVAGLRIRPGFAMIVPYGQNM
jgi:hypothetical protein